MKLFALDTFLPCIGERTSCQKLMIFNEIIDSCVYEAIRPGDLFQEDKFELV